MFVSLKSLTKKHKLDACQIQFTNFNMIDLDRRIQQTIKLTSNYDPDRQYMAIKNLSDIIETESSKIPANTLMTIIDTILKFLDDQNKDLQGLAIDRLSKVITKIPPEGNRRICVQMTTKLSDLQTPNQFRGIYSTALKSIIKEVSLQLGSQLKDLFLDLITQVLFTADGKYNKIQQLLIQVIDAFISKWGSLIGKLQFPKMKFSQLLLDNVISNSHLSKSAASSLCLGKLAGILKQQQLEQILYKNGLINFINSKTEAKDKKLAFQTLKLIIQSHNNNLIKFAKELIDFLFKVIKQYKSDKNAEQQIERLDVICDILEHAIGSVQAIIEAFPNQIKIQLINSTTYFQDIGELVSFSPGSRITYLQNKVQLQDEDDDDYDSVDENQSYRVRRAATILVCAMGKLDQSLAGNSIYLTKLYDRLLESNAEVREAAFSGLETLVHCITVDDSSTHKTDIDNMELFPLKRARTTFKSSSLEFLERLLKKLSQVTAKNTIDQKTILQAARLLSSLCRSFTTTISQSNNVLNQTLSLLERQLKINKHFPQAKTYILDAFSSIFLKKIPSNKSDYYLKLMTQNLQKNSEVALAAFQAIDNLLQNHQTQYGNKSQAVYEFVPIACSELREKSYKVETRKAIVQCISKFLDEYCCYLNPDVVAEILKELGSKLEIESSKKSILVALTKLNLNIQINKNVMDSLNYCLTLITNNFINHKNQSIALFSHQAIAKIIQLLKRDFSSASAKRLVDMSKQMKNIFPKYLDVVLQLYPALFKDMLNELMSMDEVPVYVVQKLLHERIITKANCLVVLKAKARPQNIESVVKILKILNEDNRAYAKEIGNHVWGRVALRFMGDSGNTAHFDLLKKHAFGDSDSDTRCQASIALGSLISYHFQALMPQLINSLPELSKQNILNAFLAVKESITRSTIDNYPQIDNLFAFLLGEIQQGRIGDQPILNLLSECVAKQISMKPIESERLLNFICHSQNHCHKHLFASMFNFLDHSVLEMTDYIRPRINQLFEMLDGSPPNLKTQALKSLAHLTNRIPHTVLYCIDEKSFKLVRNCSLLDDSLIKEEIIVIKTLVDYGKPMRLQAFLFLQTALDEPTNQAFDMLGLYPQILQAAMQRIQDQKEIPMFLTRLALIKGIAAIDSHILVAESTRFKQILEPYLVKIDADSRYSKSLLENFYSIYLNTKKNFNIEIEELYQIACSRTEIKGILVEIEKEYD